LTRNAKNLTLTPSGRFKGGGASPVKKRGRDPKKKKKKKNPSTGGGAQSPGWGGNIPHDSGAKKKGRKGGGAHFEKWPAFLHPKRGFHRRAPGEVKSLRLKGLGNKKKKGKTELTFPPDLIRPAGENPSPVLKSWTLKKKKKMGNRYVQTGGGSTEIIPPTAGN